MTTTIGDFIRAKRQELGLTQNALASKLGWDSPQFISNIERDEAQLPPERIRDVSKILKVKPEEFIKLHMYSYRKGFEEKVFKGPAKKTMKKK